VPHDRGGRGKGREREREERGEGGRRRERERGNKRGGGGVCSHSMVLVWCTKAWGRHWRMSNGSAATGCVGGHSLCLSQSCRLPPPCASCGSRGVPGWSGTAQSAALPVPLVAVPGVGAGRLLPWPCSTSGAKWWWPCGALVVTGGRNHRWLGEGGAHGAGGRLPERNQRVRFYFTVLCKALCRQR